MLPLFISLLPTHLSPYGIFPTMPSPSSLIHGISERDTKPQAPPPPPPSRCPFLVLDVRDPDDYRSCHIVGGVFSVFEKERRSVCVCTCVRVRFGISYFFLLLTLPFFFLLLLF